MKHRLTMRYSKKEGELVWKYNSHRTKYIGYDIAKTITKNFDNGHLTVEEFAKLKLTCTFENTDDETNKKA